jgi:signal transduction histidine kinase
VVLIALSLGVFIWRVGTWLDTSRFAETRHDQEGRTILMASAAEESLEKFRTGQIDAAGFQEEVLTLSRGISQPLIVLDPQGNIILDSENLDPVQGNESKNPEIAAAFEGQVTSDVRYDPDDKAEVLFTASPVRHDRDLIGIVRLELPMSAVAAASWEMWARLIGAGLLAAFATVLVSFWFSQSLVRPIGELTRAASAMAEGDLRQRIHARGPAELQQLARGFNFMAERISVVMEDQRAFVANAAHELRTPLTTIRLRAEALREGARDDPAVASRFLGDIESETERLSRLTEELLSLSRIETGLVEPRREPVSLQKLINAVVSELSIQVQEAHLSLDVAVPERLPFVHVNPDQIRQVCINLLGNAIKFTPPGGAIRVQVSMLEGRTSSQLGRGRWLVTQVCDTGMGIPEEDLPHVFERFYRSGKVRARDPFEDLGRTATPPGSGGGAGLGLAIVKSILDAHSGRVWAESQEGKGTVMTFALPLQ